MAKITKKCYEATGHAAVICDFSPPRSGDASVGDDGFVVIGDRLQLVTGGDREIALRLDDEET